MPVTLKVNGASRTVSAEPDTPLLYVLRNDFALNGAKFGCGLAQCGACTVHVEGEAVRSCVLPLQAVRGKKVTSIEGLSADRSHALQQAWIDIQVPHCGYCQNGMMIQAADLLR